MHPSLARVDHRPWPLPSRPWAWRQSWCDLLFAHWPVEAEVLRPLVPEGLEIDEFEGVAWIGVVPFRMSGVMRRPFPDLPWISAFPELNVRTYVRGGGKAGVWFLSLDATNPLAVWAARRFFHLPYHRAAITLSEDHGRVRYRSRRGGFLFEGSYGPASPVVSAPPGSLDHWLVERYCLFAKDRGGFLRRTDVHHAPWPLQRAEADLRENTMLVGHGIDVKGPPAHLRFARRIDVVAWPSERVG